MFYVYLIQNGDKKIYIGQTDNIKARLKRHNGQLVNKKSSYTYKNKGYWELIYYETLQTRKLALEREKYLKSHTEEIG